jgi:hypothetical protein
MGDAACKSGEAGGNFYRFAGWPVKAVARRRRIVARPIGMIYPSYSIILF